MTEFVVILTTFMVPLFFIVLTFAQSISLRQDAESATRYTAWQRTIWKSSAAYVDPNFSATEPAVAPTTVKSDDQIAREIDTRLLSSPDTQIYTTQNNATLTLKPFAMTSLGAPSGSQTPLLQYRAGSTPGNPRYALTEPSSNTVAPGIAAGTPGYLIWQGVTNSFQGLRFKMDTRGLVKAELSFSMIEVPQWLWPESYLGTNHLGFTRSLTLYTDGWNPGGRYDERYRVAGLLPEELHLDNNAIHHKQNQFSSTMAKVLHCDNQDFTQVGDGNCYLDPGYVNVDAVPSARLTN